jgi:hypothetical protein
MNLTLDVNLAKQSDSHGGAIKESGAYIGTITRAQALRPQSGSKGVGFSIKTDDGLTANYLDIYTHKATGEALNGLKTVMAILACTKTRQANVGQISFDKYDKETKSDVRVNAQGYPDLMGKRIGLLLKQELTTYEGKDKSSLVVYGVYEADTGFTASEILDKATMPEKMKKMLDVLMKNPVSDKREKQQSNDYYQAPSSNAVFNTLDDDIPF